MPGSYMTPICIYSNPTKPTQALSGGAQTGSRAWAVQGRL